MMILFNLFIYIYIFIFFRLLFCPVCSFRGRVFSFHTNLFCLFMGSYNLLKHYYQNIKSLLFDFGVFLLTLFKTINCNDFNSSELSGLYIIISILIYYHLSVTSVTSSRTIAFWHPTIQIT